MACKTGLGIRKIGRVGPAPRTVGASLKNNVFTVVEFINARAIEAGL